MNIVFFKRPRPRQFHYQPRYYDPEKEALEQRRKELGLSQEMDHREKLRFEMRRQWSARGGTASRKGSVERIIYYSILAILVIYVVFFTDLIKNMMSFFIGK